MGGRVSKPRSSIVINNCGLSYQRQGSNEEAIECFSEAIAIDPLYINAFYNRSLSHQALGNLELAVNDLDMVIEFDRSHSSALYRRGFIHYQQDKILPAISDFSRVIELDSTKARAFYYRGIAYGTQHKRELAIRDLTHSIELDPKRPEAFSMRGAHFLVLKDLPRAIADFDEAIRLKPDYVYAFYKRSLAHQLHGYPERSLADFNKLYQLDPKIISEFDAQMLKNIYINFHDFYQVIKKRLSFSQRLSACYQGEVNQYYLKFYDPVTLEVMDDPISFTTTGQTYNRATIERWFNQKGNPDSVECPLTRKPISRSEFDHAVTHVLTKKCIEEFIIQLEELNRPVQIPVKCKVETLSGGLNQNLKRGPEVSFFNQTTSMDKACHGQNSVLALKEQKSPSL